MHRPAESTPLHRARSAANSVLDRRRDRQVEDPDLERFPDLDDPLSPVISFLAAVIYISRFQRVPDPILQSDALDQLTLIDHVRGDLDKRTLAAIRLARRKGATWIQIARAMGLASRQGAEQLFQRLAHAAEVKDGVRDERAARAARRRAATGTDRATLLRGFVDELLALTGQLPQDVVDDLTYLTTELDRGRPAALPPSFETHLRLAVADLRAAGVTGETRRLVDQRARELGI